MSISYLNQCKHINTLKTFLILSTFSLIFSVAHKRTLFDVIPKPSLLKIFFSIDRHCCILDRKAIIHYKYI